MRAVGLCVSVPCGWFITYVNHNVAYHPSSHQEWSSNKKPESPCKSHPCHQNHVQTKCFSARTLSFSTWSNACTLNPIYFTRCTLSIHSHQANVCERAAGAAGRFAYQFSYDFQWSETCLTLRLWPPRGGWGEKRVTMFAGVHQALRALRVCAMLTACHSFSRIAGWAFANCKSPKKTRAFAIQKIKARIYHSHFAPSAPLSISSPLLSLTWMLILNVSEYILIQVPELHIRYIWIINIYKLYIRYGVLELV